MNRGGQVTSIVVEDVGAIETQLECLANPEKVRGKTDVPVS
jgi:predicted alpha/beta-hydrolase family hydrolase